MKLVKLLPFLFYIDIKRTTFSGDEAFDFISKFKFRDMFFFYFKLDDTTDYEHFKARLSDEFEIHADDRIISMYRLAKNKLK